MAIDLTTTADVLSSKGLSLLSNLVASSAGAGIDHLQKYVAEKTGVNITDTQQLEMLSTEDITQLQQFEASYQRDILLAYTADNRTRLENTQGARDMFLTTMEKGDTTHSRFLHWYGGILSGLTILYIFAITYIPIPPANARFADTCLGFLIGNGLSVIINFFFGSSMLSRPTAIKKG